MVIISSSIVMITIAGTDEAFVLVRRILLVAFASFDLEERVSLMGNGS